MPDVIIPTDGGRARHSDGTLADIPHDMAHEINSELFDVLTLIMAALDEVDGIEQHDPGRDRYGHTSSASRAASLSRMATDKVHGILTRMSPFV